MVFEFNRPTRCQGEVLDRFLQEGWFRDGSMMSRYELIYFREHIFSVLPLRARLEGFAPSKGQRKLLRRNADLRAEFSPLRLDSRKEVLYQQHKHRFKSPNSPRDLRSYFMEEEGGSPFQTWELCLYEGGVLAGVSFFDLGAESLCSILALFDPAYEDRSLGIFTMLLEAAFAQQQGMRYYYPGYILDEPSVFDYKRRLANLEFFDWKGGWHPIEELPRHPTSNARLRQQLGKLQTQLLERYDLSSQLLENEAYFYHVWHQTFDLAGVVHAPMYLELQNDWGHRFIVEYQLERGTYTLALEQYTEVFAETPSREQLLLAVEQVYNQADMLAQLQQQAIAQVVELLQHHLPSAPSQCYVNRQRLDGFLELSVEGSHLTFYISYKAYEGRFELTASNQYRERAIDGYADPQELVRTLLHWLHRRSLHGL